MSLILVLTDFQNLKALFIIKLICLYRTVPEDCSSYEKDQDPVEKGCILPRLSHYPLMSGPLEEKFEIFRTCPAVAKRQSLFKMQPAYKVGRKNSLKHPRRTEYDIMYEIMTHGPVQGMRCTVWKIWLWR